jgi:hypothetical protein
MDQTGTKTIIDTLTELSQHDGGIRRGLANTTNPYPRHQEVTQKISAYTAEELAEALKRLSFAVQSKIYLFWTNPRLTAQIAT